MPLAQLDLDLLRCPVTGDTVAEVTPPRSLALGLGGLEKAFRQALDPGSEGIRWIGAPQGIRYPVLGRVPLLTQEHAHTAKGPLPSPASTVTPDELDFYNRAALDETGHVEKSNVFDHVRRAALRPEGFPDDIPYWIDSPYDGPAQLRSYSFLAPIVRNGRIAQVGGQGSHAVKLLIAGARRTVIVSPILGELVLALAYAHRIGVLDQLDAVLGVGEQLPLADSSLNGAFCGGTLHHMNTAAAGAELSRTLAPAGRFAAMEPWRVPVLYRAGVTIMGKREAVGCRPLDPSRLEALRSMFHGEVEIRQHGALTRYPLLALAKAGIRPHKDRLIRLMLRDDKAMTGPLRRLGGSVSITGTAHSD
jgi:hypothetical protein